MVYIEAKISVVCCLFRYISDHRESPAGFGHCRKLPENKIRHSVPENSETLLSRSVSLR